MFEEMIVGTLFVCCIFFIFFLFFGGSYRARCFTEGIVEREESWNGK